MKVALLDLNHMMRGVHTNTVSLGAVLIAHYLQKILNYQFDIKLFKRVESFLSILTSWVPDIIGITQYCWNSELNLYVAHLAKQVNPDCLVVAGGPNLELSKSGKILFLKTRSFVDICVSYDGEIPFAEILRRLVSGEKNIDVRRNPVAGSYSLDPETGEFIDSFEKPPRLSTLNVFGPVYAGGFFDEQLEDGFHPFVQTHRGCPFTCAFCHTSDTYHSKILFLSPNIFRRDMDYLGKRFAGQHEITLYIANTNMGLFDEDFEIAKIIRQIQEKYDWPRYINVNAGKNPKRLLDMFSIIKIQPTIDLQTLTSNVLKNIKRKNITFKDFVTFQHKVFKKTDRAPSTSLILCLPGETKETFFKTLRAVLNSGVRNIVIYTLMKLKGTLLASEEYAKRYSYVVRHRVVPRQFSIVNGEKILDTEEVVVSTNTMSFEDYLELRGISFTITVFFSSTELIPLKRLMLEYGVDIAQWVFGIHQRLSEFPALNSNFENFMKETKEELFVTRDALLEFFNKPDNFKALCSGHLGDNLLRKYKCIVLSKYYKSALKLAISEAGKLLCKHIGKDTSDSLLNDMSLYLSTRDLKEVFKKADPYIKKIFHLNYNLIDWMQNFDNSLRLEDFYGSFDYRVVVTDEIKKRFQEFIRMNRDFDLSLQILYRDGIIRDFWPIWSLRDKKNKFYRR